MSMIDAAVRLGSDNGRWRKRFIGGSGVQDHFNVEPYVERTLLLTAETQRRRENLNCFFLFVSAPSAVNRRLLRSTTIELCPSLPLRKPLRISAPGVSWLSSTTKTAKTKATSLLPRRR